MGGLFHSLGIGSQSLFATRQGIDTTAHNVANAQTDGYSRQNIDLEQRDPSHRYGVFIGNGVFVGSIKRSHDSFMERQINENNASLGGNESRHAAMLNLETIFSPELTASISQELSRFFDSLQTLSTFPEDLTSRTSVIENGKNLAGAFRHADTELRNYRSGVNEEVKSIVLQLEDITSNIASLNKKIRSSENGEGQFANDLRDQRDRLLRKLSENIDISYYEDQYGMVAIRGPGETLLVERGHSAGISWQRDGKREGMYSIKIHDFEGNLPRDITDKVSGGRLGALVDIRDRVVTKYIGKNNELATTFVEQFNEIHRQGFGLKEYRLKNGRNFFIDIKDKNFAAQNMQIDTSILNSTDAIATASTANSAGDNVVVNKLLALKAEKVLRDGNATFTEYYADFVGDLGIETLRAEHMLDASKIMAKDLKARSDAVSGVSLDEEAANMLRWQTAFTASSKIITTIDEMLEALLNIKR